MSAYSQHVAKWSNCQACELCHTRKNVVLGRGDLPCDVAFIGEAPGDGEDVLGLPFKGPAGHLLNTMISAALTSVNPGRKIRMWFTNLIACIPKIDGVKDEPSKEHIAACHSRLVEVINIAKPKVIVLVGKLSKQNVVGESDFSLRPQENSGKVSWLPQDQFIQFYDVLHPAAILRSDVTAQPLSIKRVVVTLEEAFRAAVKI